MKQTKKEPAVAPDKPVLAPEQPEKKQPVDKSGWYKTDSDD
jgi:hypothetical protein